MTADPPAAPPAPPSPWRWGVCVLLMLATVLNYMDRMALNQTAVRIQLSLGIDDYQYSWLEGVFSFAFAIGAVATGFVVDRVSVRWVYPLMVLGWSAAGFLTGFANTFAMLFLCRFALGLFEAGNWPCGIRTTRAIMKPEERSFGNAIFQSGTALGAVVTPLVVLALVTWADPYEATRTAVMAAVGGGHAAVDPAPSDSWRLPFRVIGLLGVTWVVVWFLAVPRRMLDRGRAEEAAAAPANGGSGTFTDVFRDSRFWVLFALVVAINITWHSYRTWLPVYLIRTRGFSFAEMSWFTTVYYLVADVGSWTAGLATLGLIRWGVGPHAARTLTFGGCAALCLVTLLVPVVPNGWPLIACLLTVAFGALGLFPLYFALSQEISAKHQGKVTGTLGAGAHMALAVLMPIQGKVVTATASYAGVLGAIGVAPLVALVVMVVVWPPRKADARST